MDDDLSEWTFQSRASSTQLSVWRTILQVPLYPVGQQLQLRRPAKASDCDIVWDVDTVVTVKRITAVQTPHDTGTYLFTLVRADGEPGELKLVQSKVKRDTRKLA